MRNCVFSMIFLVNHVAENINLDMKSLSRVAMQVARGGLARLMISKGIPIVSIQRKAQRCTAALFPVVSPRAEPGHDWIISPTILSVFTNSSGTLRMTTAAGVSYDSELDYQIFF